MRTQIITSLIDILENVIGLTNVISDRVSTNNVGYNLVDCVLIAVTGTSFNNRGQGSLYVPELNVDLVVFAPETSSPLTTILAKEDSILNTLLSDPTLGGLASDTVIESSTASNVIESYQALGEVSSVIRMRISYAKRFN